METILPYDDSKHHLERMEVELAKIGIEYFGFHYTKCRERLFDPEVAAKEYREMSGKWEEELPTQ